MVFAFYVYNLYEVCHYSGFLKPGSAEHKSPPGPAIPALFTLSKVWKYTLHLKDKS